MRSADLANWPPTEGSACLTRFSLMDGKLWLSVSCAIRALITESHYKDSKLAELFYTKQLLKYFKTITKVTCIYAYSNMIGNITRNIMWKMRCVTRSSYSESLTSSQTAGGAATARASACFRGISTDSESNPLPKEHKARPRSQRVRFAKRSTDRSASKRMVSSDAPKAQNPSRQAPAGGD